MKSFWVKTLPSSLLVAVYLLQVVSLDVLADTTHYRNLAPQSPFQPIAIKQACVQSILGTNTASPPNTAPSQSLMTKLALVPTDLLLECALLVKDYSKCGFLPFWTGKTIDQVDLVRLIDSFYRQYVIALKLRDYSRTVGRKEYRTSLPTMKQNLEITVQQWSFDQVRQVAQYLYRAKHPHALDQSPGKQLALVKQHNFSSPAVRAVVMQRVRSVVPFLKQCQEFLEGTVKVLRADVPSRVTVALTALVALVTSIFAIFQPYYFIQPAQNRLAQQPRRLGKRQVASITPIRSRRPGKVVAKLENTNTRNTAPTIDHEESRAQSTLTKGSGAQEAVADAHKKAKETPTTDTATTSVSLRPVCLIVAPGKLVFENNNFGQPIKASSNQRINILGSNDSEKAATIARGKTPQRRNRRFFRKLARRVRAKGRRIIRRLANKEKEEKNEEKKKDNKKNNKGNPLVASADGYTIEDIGTLEGELQSTWDPSRLDPTKPLFRQLDEQIEEDQKDIAAGKSVIQKRKDQTDPTTKVDEDITTPFTGKSRIEEIKETTPTPKKEEEHWECKLTLDSQHQVVRFSFAEGLMPGIEDGHYIERTTQEGIKFTAQKGKLTLGLGLVHGTKDIDEEVTVKIPIIIPTPQGPLTKEITVTEQEDSSEQFFKLGAHAEYKIAGFLTGKARIGGTFEKKPQDHMTFKKFSSELGFKLSHQPIGLLSLQTDKGETVPVIQLAFSGYIGGGVKVQRHSVKGGFEAAMEAADYSAGEFMARKHLFKITPTVPVKAGVAFIFDDPGIVRQGANLVIFCEAETDAYQMGHQLSQSEDLETDAYSVTYGFELGVPLYKGEKGGELNGSLSLSRTWMPPSDPFPDNSINSLGVNIQGKDVLPLFKDITLGLGVTADDTYLHSGGEEGISSAQGSLNLGFIATDDKARKAFTEAPELDLDAKEAIEAQGFLTQAENLLRDLFETAEPWSMILSRKRLTAQVANLPENNEKRLARKTKLMRMLELMDKGCFGKHNLESFESRLVAFFDQGGYPIDYRFKNVVVRNHDSFAMGAGNVSNISSNGHYTAWQLPATRDQLRLTLGKQLFDKIEDKFDSGIIAMFLCHEATDALLQHIITPAMKTEYAIDDTDIHRFARLITCCLMATNSNSAALRDGQLRALIRDVRDNLCREKAEQEGPFNPMAEPGLVMQAA